VVLAGDDPLAVAATEAVQRGDLERLRLLLTEHPGLARAAIGDHRPGGMSRSLPHGATDWPGHFPNNVATVKLLPEHGADVNARFTGPHTETPVHWAASSDDVDVLDALLADKGADIHWVSSWDGSTPLEAARRGRDEDTGRDVTARQVDRHFASVVDWLESLRARVDVVTIERCRAPTPLRDGSRPLRTGSSPPSSIPTR
jgi:hypothetical protein